MSALREVVRRTARTATLFTGLLALVLLVMPSTTGRISLASSSYLCSGSQ